MSEGKPCSLYYNRKQKRYYKFKVQQPLPSTNQTGCCWYTPVSNNRSCTEKLSGPYIVVKEYVVSMSEGKPFSLYYTRKQKSYHKFQVQQPLSSKNQTGCCWCTPVSNNRSCNEKLSGPYIAVKQYVVSMSKGKPCSLYHTRQESYSSS